MPAFGFKERFAKPIEQGIKRQTIRAERKDGRQPCRPGDTLTLWTNWRRKNARKLADVRCTFCSPIVIDRTDAGPTVTIRGRALTSHEIEELAFDDAFLSVGDFLAFFQDTHGLPFKGWVIKWEAGHGR